MRNITLVFPPNVIQNQELTATEKLILGYYFSFFVSGWESQIHQQTMVCEILGLNRRTFLSSEKNLITMGYIEKEIVYDKNGGAQGRRIKINQRKLSNG